MDSTPTPAPPGQNSTDSILDFDSYDGLHFHKVPICIRDDYVIYLEQVRGASIIHCNVHRWTARVKEALSVSFKVVQILHGGPLFALHEAGDIKHLKFLHLFNFRPIGASYMDSSNGRIIEIFTAKANA